MKISTITLNPAVDRAMYFESAFRVGELNRAARTVTAVGGKGINVSRAASMLGIATDAYGFVGGAAGEMVRQSLTEAGVVCRLTETECETRVNIKFIDCDGQCTEANERGGPMTPDEVERMAREVERGAHYSTTNPGSLNHYFVMGGSIPQGVENDVYNLLITMLKDCGARTVLDSSGEGLRRGAEARPYMIKPNAYELFDLTGESPENMESAVEIAKRYFGKTGIRLLCTLGKTGSLYVGPEGFSTAIAPQVAAKSFAGAGDTYLAAFLSRYREGEYSSVKEALRFATSAAAAKVELEGTVFPDAKAMSKYM